MPCREHLARYIADAMTALRLVIAALIVLLGMLRRRAALEVVMLASLLGWTVDTLDGHVARRDRSGRRTWLSDNDRTVDALMVLAGFLYLALAGFVAWWFCWLYISVSALLIAYFQSKVVTTLLEIPPVLMMPLVSLEQRPWLGLTWLAWGLAALLLDWRRFWMRVRILWDDLRKA